MIDLVNRILGSEKLSVAKAISIVENDDRRAHELLRLLYKHTGKAYRIGITGPPGAGKSTITNCLTKYLRSMNKTVGIIAVDPTSPFTGGALLGDRIRMQETGLDPGVFIRSMATRGSLGGLARKAKEACEVLDASGKDFILIETVGVGQSELDIAQASDTTIVVLVPESGDSVQTMKAGLMEIGDIFVINKSDREGADVLAVALRTMLQLKMKSHDDYHIGVVKTIASECRDVDKLWTEIERHRTHLESEGKMLERRKGYLIRQINELVSHKLEDSFWSEEKKEFLRTGIDSIISRDINPYDFVDKLFNKSVS